MTATTPKLNPPFPSSWWTPKTRKDGKAEQTENWNSRSGLSKTGQAETWRMEKPDFAHNPRQRRGKRTPEWGTESKVRNCWHEGPETVENDQRACHSGLTHRSFFIRANQARRPRKKNEDLPLCRTLPLEKRAQIGETAHRGAKRIVQLCPLPPWTNGGGGGEPYHRWTEWGPKPFLGRGFLVYFPLSWVFLPPSLSLFSFVFLFPWCFSCWRFPRSSGVFSAHFPGF